MNTSPVVEWQMVVKDPDAAAAFCGRLFGWTIDANNALGYRRVSTGPGGLSGGIWPSPSNGHSLVQLFIGVESVPDYHRRAEEMGARTIVAPQKLPDGDELAIMLDPSGVAFGLIKKRGAALPPSREASADRRSLGGGG
jgi:predicted enzyme related to lactoylglutathione lyase